MGANVSPRQRAAVPRSYDAAKVVNVGTTRICTRCKIVFRPIVSAHAGLRRVASTKALAIFASQMISDDSLSA